MVENQDMAIIFKIVSLNDELEQLVPEKVVIGKQSRNKYFIDISNNTRYKHICSASEVDYCYGKRNVLATLEEKKLEKIMIERLDYYKRYTFLRYKSKPSVIFMSLPGADMFQYDDIDCNDAKIDYIPKEIEDSVKKTVVGQDEAVRKIVTSLWMTLNFPKMKKRNMFVIGPTGVGKTLIFEKLQKILNVPLVIFPVPGLSQAGYTGRSTDEILKQIYYDCDEDTTKFDKVIVVLDELDKLAYGSGNDGEISTLGVQSELLKIIEGVNRTVEVNNGMDSFDIDTSKMIFVGLGAFSGIFDDKEKTIGFDTVSNDVKKKVDSDKLTKYGLKRELVGRLPVIVELESMNKEKLKNIIVNSDESELKHIIDALQTLGVAINNVDDIVDIIVEDALKKQIGARGLIATINNIFMEIFYEVANNPKKYREIVIGKNILNDENDFELIEKKVKKKTRKEFVSK